MPISDQEGSDIRQFRDRSAANRVTFMLNIKIAPYGTASHQFGQHLTRTSFTYRFLIFPTIYPQTAQYPSHPSG